MEIKINESDSEAFSLINNKLSCASKALNIRVIPKGVDQETIEKYLKSVLGIQSGYKYLLDSWWKKVRVDYNLGEGNLKYVHEKSIIVYGEV